MKRTISVILTTILLASWVCGQEPVRFTGKFDTKLVFDSSYTYQTVLKPEKTPPLRFAEPLKPGTAIAAGAINDGVSATGKTNVYLVEPAGRQPFLALDADASGVIETNERHAFIAQPGAPDDLEVIIKFPTKNPLFPGNPVLLRYKRGFTHPSIPPGGRLVIQPYGVYALGRVNINGRSVLFQYPFDPAAATISATEGLFGVDTDGDGRINTARFSPEIGYTTNSQLVFRLGDIYVSTEKVDMVKNEITVRKREKAEYLRYEIETGREMPNFEFTDLAGKARSLAEFRGKYLLVDFWGVWCVDCRRETPFQVEAYKQFRSRGFEILGLDWDDKIEMVTDYMAKSGMAWTQARKDSIRELSEVRYRIYEYPSTLLLGPDGKVVVLDQEKLQGEELAKTLDKILPK
jgi:thiol-disulfide isomerase/thioredoxin